MFLLNAAFKVMPLSLQNTAVSLVNSNSYRVRHGGKYKEYLITIKNGVKLTKVILKKKN